MRLKTIATLFAVSAVILTGSPAFATPVSHHETHGQNQFCGAFAGCSPRDIGLQHLNSGNEVPDHWPNNLLLG